jgi:DNA-binding transcriptional ArsR family regulator
MNLSGYVFEALRKDEEFILYRGQSKDVGSQVLASKPRSGEQLAELLSIKGATVSHHLSKLADAGLVTSPSEGHKKFYTLRINAVRSTA